MDARTRNLIRERAGHCCEYCGVPDDAYELPFHVEHIVANVHQLNDDVNNLAWACPRCNLHKGPNLITIDPESGEHVNLFNPRSDSWGDHFEMIEFVIRGTSAVGRGTVRLLNMNASLRVEHRREMMS